MKTSKDLIDRQAAIDALAKFVPYAICDASTESYTNGLTDAYNLICQLPSVQPQRKTDEWCTDCQEYDSEKHCCPRWNRVIRETLSEHPEIIRCKDCRYQDKGCNESESWNLCGYRPWLHVPTEDEHYCGYAERRIDEQTD